MLDKRKVQDFILLNALAIVLELVEKDGEPVLLVGVCSARSSTSE
jgi:hypothetical protein